MRNEDKREAIHDLLEALASVDQLSQTDQRKVLSLSEPADVDRIRKFITEYYDAAALHVGDIVQIKPGMLISAAPKEGELVMVTEVFKVSRSATDHAVYCMEPYDFRFAYAIDEDGALIQLPGNSKRFTKVAPEPVEIMRDPYGEFEPRV